MNASGTATTRKWGASAAVTRKRSSTVTALVKTTSFSCSSWRMTRSCRIASMPTPRGMAISRSRSRSSSGICALIVCRPFLDRRKIAGALAFAGLAAHAFFLPISIAGMQIALAVAGAGLLIRLPRPLRTPLDLPALAFVAVAIASDVLSPYGSPGLASATLWRSLLGFFVVAHALRLLRPEAPRQLLICAAGGLLCASIVGIVQYRTGIDLVHDLGLRQEPALVEAPGVEGRYGAMGFFTSRLTFGHNATVVLSLIGGALAARALPRRAAIAASTALAAGLFAVALTFDRAAWLGLLVAAGVILINARHRIWAFALASAATLAMFHPAIRARFRSA